MASHRARAKWQANLPGCLCVIALAALSLLVAGCAPAKTTGLARSMGWVAQQSGTGADLTGVCFTSVSDGWAIGEAGTLLATSDGGVHWRGVDCGTSEDLFAVTFSDKLHGWLLGGDEVIRTVDGGKHWSVVRLGSSLALTELAFTDSLHGIAAGVIAHGARFVGIIECTSDGGAHWHTAWEQNPRFHFTQKELLLGGHTIAPYSIAVLDRRHISQGRPAPSLRKSFARFFLASPFARRRRRPLRRGARARR